jgi:DNA-binding SARP family transcriptional activator
MDFRVLGPFEVVDGGNAIPLGGRRQRAVLALLTIHAGEVLSIDRIVDEVWAGSPPPSAVRTVQVYVSRLRSALHPSRSGAGDGVLMSVDPGYLLAVDRSQIDAFRFEQAVAEGSAFLAAGDAASAAQTLRDALGIWRGTALADFAYEPFAAVEAQRLTERRLEALERRIDADLALGHHASVIAELEGLVTDHPLREGFWAQLMTALYRGGRQAEALAAYGRVRQVLVEELGIDPGPRLQRLERLVLEKSAELAWHPATGGREPVSSGGEPVSGGGEPVGVGLPTRLAFPPATGVIARETEMELLADALKRVTTGEGREVVLVSGDPGLGKTTLASEASRRAFDVGACVLLGRCNEDLGLPYGPFVEALTHYVMDGPLDLLRSHVTTYGAELSRMVPALRQKLGVLPAPQSTDPDTERYLLFGAVVGLLTEVSARQPLVLVVDDLQWADKPSLQLLRHVVTSAEPMRLLVIATYRDSELTGPHPLTETLPALRREPGVSRIELRGLDDSGVIAFMEAAAGHDLDDTGVDLAHAVYRETDGNPFFVNEILRHLSETGVIYQDATGRWTAARDVGDMTLPDSVREVVAARVARLGEHAARAMSFASVIGRDFDLRLLSEVTEYSEDTLLDILDGATAASLVREAGDAPSRYSFSHALVQHTLYQGMGMTRRARAHRLVAESLETLCGDHPGERVGELAHHWFNATQPVDLAKAIDYARQAAEAAVAALAPDDAVRYYSQALQLIVQLPDPDPLMQVDLLLGLGHAQSQAGIPGFSETLLDAAHRAQALGATDRLVAAGLANNRGWGALGVVDTEKVAVLEAALEATAAVDSPERAVLLATLCSELSFGPPDQRLALADEARAMARRLGDPTTLVRVLNLFRTTLNVPSLHEQRISESAEALAIAETLGDPVHLVSAATMGHISAVQAGDFDRGARCMALEKTLSERLRQPVLIWNTTFHEAAYALLAGDPERAEELATLALQIGSDCGQPDATAYYGGQLMEIRTQQGRLGELTPLIAQLRADNPGVPALNAALAKAYLEAGERTEAMRLLDVAVSDRFASLPEDNAWMDAVVRYAGVAIELRTAAHAAPLLELLAPYHAMVPFQGLLVMEPVATYLGGLASVLGRNDDAESFFAEASDLCTRGEMKFAEAVTGLLWGRMLLVRQEPGDVERGRQLLDQAGAAAKANGYAMIESRVTAELDGTT